MNYELNTNTWTTEWKQCKKILCLRPDNLGDIILMTPVFRALKESLPQTKLTLLTSTTGSKILPYIPEIDDTIIYDAPWIENDLLNNSSQRNHVTQTMHTVITKIREETFDGAILLTNFSQSPFPLAILTYLAEIPRVLGYARERPYPFITHWIPDTEPFTFPIHGVVRQLQLLATIGVKTENRKLSLSISRGIETKIKRRLKENDINKSYLILHPGASLQRRHYHPQRFIAAAQQLIKELGYDIIITGNEEEKTLITKMTQEIGDKAYSFGGQTTIEELIALIKQAKLVISNNTAPIHIAAAVQTPVVDLYARSNPEHTPWEVTHRILYFDIPSQLRSANTLLSATTPKEQTVMPQPYHIVQAVKEVLFDRKETSLPPELTTWNAINNNNINGQINQTNYYHFFPQTA